MSMVRHLRGKDHLRSGIVAIGFWAAALLPTGMQSAHAGCLPAPTAELRNLIELAGRNPTALVAATEHDPAGTIDDQSLGWRQAARAEAFDILSRPQDARKTAIRLIGGKPAPGSALYVELLTRYALNGYRIDEIDRIHPTVEATRRSLRPRSPADACMLITLGEMQRLNGNPERAVVHLADAYRMTMSPAMQQQHILAAEKLARVMDWAGDYQQALSLIEEVIQWDRSRNRTIALSTDLYFRASFHLHNNDYRAALGDYERSRMLSSDQADPVGAAFIDLKICQALIELRRFDRAETLCRSADRLLTPNDEMAGGYARLLLARIAMAHGRPQIALAALDRLLASDGALAPFASMPDAYQLRAELNDRLGRVNDAYRDTKTYLKLVEQQLTSKQARQSAVLRARFDTDRAAARNRELREKLAFSEDREREQSKRYTVLAGSAILGALLLLVILGMSIRHRRKLIRIADTDPLTGLHNRRFVHTNERMFAAGALGKDAPMSLALIDIDHFKRINDTHGHDVGDEVLMAFAALARTVFRSHDVIARWGGEEFIVILPRTTRKQAVESLERFRAILATAFVTSAGPLQVRFSAGVAEYCDIDDLQTVIRKADVALYRAKSAGRNRIDIATAHDGVRPATAACMDPRPEHLMTAD